MKCQGFLRKWKYKYLQYFVEIENGICYNLNIYKSTKETVKEIVFHNALDRVFIATDYFDASINRISAWVTGMRSVQKTLLFALLQPAERMKKLQNENRFTELMALQEDIKTAPFGDIWEEYLKREGVKKDYTEEITKYEKEVLIKRG